MSTTGSTWTIDLRDREEDRQDPAPPDRHRDGDDTSGGWMDVARRVKDRVSGDRVGLMAAGVAFKAFLALVPIIIVAVSVYGLAVDPQTVVDQIRQFAQNLPQSAAGVIEQQASQIASSTSASLGVALAISVLGALWSASGGTTGLIEGLNAAHHLDDDRGFVRKRALAIALAVGGLLLGAVLVAGLLVLPIITAAVDLGGAAAVLVEVARWTLVALLVLGALAAVYRVAPNRPSDSETPVLPGAAVGAVGWLLGTALFAWAVSAFGSFNETYGSLAGVIVLLLWLLLSAFAVLLGGYVNAELEDRS